MKIIMIGGDKRQIKIKKNLEQIGHSIHHIVRNSEINVDFTDFDAIIFPLPTTRDGVFINNQLNSDKIKICDITAKIDRQIVLSGNYTFQNLNYIDYGKDESTAILNAVPTAEGAIALAIQNTPFTLWKSKCLVVGNGKIGKVLSHRLKSFSADVTVSARRDTDFAYIESFGIRHIPTNELERYTDNFDVIFNTVDANVITAKALKKCKKSCLLIELASHPYGIDFKAADDLGLKVIMAPGLPGKMAPDTAADILTNVIVKNLKY